MNSNRGLVIAGNWKMNNGPKETENYFQNFEIEVQKKLSKKAVEALKSQILKCCLFTPSLSLPKALSGAKDLPFPIQIGAQNVHWETKGAFTGEISGAMLKEIGINWALVGHSERRQYFGETNATVLKRSESLLKQDFSIISCLGETLQEYKDHKTQARVTEQLAEGFPGESGKENSALTSGRLILAYEPVWAIGTGLTPTVSEIESVHAFIRSLIAERWTEKSAEKALIVYGGSVTPENIASILNCPNVDGALVGGASVKPESYLALLTAAAECLD